MLILVNLFWQPQLRVKIQEKDLVQERVAETPSK